MEYLWDKPQRVCLDCSFLLDQQKQCVDQIRELSVPQDEALTTDAESSYEKYFTELFPPASITRSFNEVQEEVSLAEFPMAGVLSNVSTHHRSPPIESIIFPAHALPHTQNWFAPKSAQTVDIIVVLPCFAEVTKLVLLVDNQGYHGFDLPEISVMVAERLPLFINKGMWKLAKAPVDINELAVPAGERIEFDVAQNSNSNNNSTPQAVRLVSLKLTLPELPQGQSVARRLHLGRVLVLGKIIVPLDQNPTAVAPREHEKFTKIINHGEPISRLMVKSEWTRYVREHNTLDMDIDAPCVSGFRIEVKHGNEGVNSQVKLLRVMLLGVNEKYQQMQQVNKDDESQHMVVGEYVVPKVAPSTALHFNFGQNHYCFSFVRFEFLSNYGAKEISVGKITLFALN